MDHGALLEAISANVERALVGKRKAVEGLLVALVAGGHVLIEDVPGVGKTTLAQSFARSLELEFRRLQFTPDVLPSDITGFHLFDLQTGRREYHPGAAMTQVLLADEINRSSPKTQSSLLEVMEEGQVTVDGETRPVPRPFLVLATQNPAEYTGTYPLPEAQLDRFLLRIDLGYPSHREELDILRRHADRKEPLQLAPVASADEVEGLREAALEVHVSAPVLEYIARITEATRSHEAVALGISPRGGIALMRAARARAFLAGRTFVLPDDVQQVAGPVLVHRLVLRPEAALRGGSAARQLQEILRGIQVPAVR